MEQENSTLADYMPEEEITKDNAEEIIKDILNKMMEESSRENKTIEIDFKDEKGKSHKIEIVPESETTAQERANKDKSHGRIKLDGNSFTLGGAAKGLLTNAAKTVGYAAKTAGYAALTVGIGGYKVAKKGLGYAKLEMLHEIHNSMHQSFSR